MKTEILLSTASLIIFFAVLVISYLVYKSGIPTLDAQINIIPDNNNDSVLTLRKMQKITHTSTDGFFLCFQIANSGFRTITAMFVVDENNETIIPIVNNKSEFGYTLTEGETITHMSDVSKNGVEHLGKPKNYILKIRQTENI